MMEKQIAMHRWTDYLPRAAADWYRRRDDLAVVQIIDPEKRGHSLGLVGPVIEKLDREFVIVYQEADQGQFFSISLQDLFQGVFTRHDMKGRAHSYQIRHLGRAGDSQHSGVRFTCDIPPSRHD